VIEEFELAQWKYIGLGLFLCCSADPQPYLQVVVSLNDSMTMSAPRTRVSFGGANQPKGLGRKESRT